jgi:hypothetical protein
MFNPNSILSSCTTPFSCYTWKKTKCLSVNYCIGGSPAPIVMCGEAEYVDFLSYLPPPFLASSSAPVLDNPTLSQFPTVTFFIFIYSIIVAHTGICYIYKLDAMRRVKLASTGKKYVSGAFHAENDEFNGLSASQL